ncbi:MAG: SurA N-terminal domain-containing protein [Eubacterium sp.]|nr:SurA N-terminal domain-containing protein [Eubacterium sp.]
MKKRMIIVSSLLVCVIAFASIGIISSAGNRYNSDSVSETQRELYHISKNDLKEIDKNWKYDPTIVDRKMIDSQSDEVAKQTGQDKKTVQKKMIDRAVETRALYLAALDAGFSATDSEVKNEIDDLKRVIHEDPEAEKDLKAVIDGYEMSEDEYWKKVAPQYKTGIIVNKYLDKEYEKRKSKTKGFIDGEKEQKLETEWRQEIVNSAIKKYGRE